MSLGNNKSETVIIDTDPGIDDALAILLMLSSPEVQVRAITLTHGNTSLQSCKRNIVTILTAMQEQRAYLGREILRDELPIVAVGCDKPLKRTPISAAYFHGQDGLGEIYDKGLYAAPPDWESQLLHRAGEIMDEKFQDIVDGGSNKPVFQTTERDAADEILHQLNIAPPLTVTILAVGPLSNIASAYQRDPATFSRAKRVVIMGGAVDAPGNVTPTAEFNFCADPDAADIVMGASKGFRHTPEGKKHRLELIEKGEIAPVHVVIFPLDSSDDGIVTEKNYRETILPLNGKTPLGTFCCAFLKWAYEVSKKLFGIDSLSVYDAFTGLLVIDMASDSGDGQNSDPEFDKHWQSRYLDLRVETRGKYTLGMCVYDKRDRSHTESAWDDEPNNVQVIDRANGPRFTKILLDRIFGASDTN